MYHRFKQRLFDLGPHAGEPEAAYQARMHRRALKTILFVVVVAGIIGAIE